MSAEPRVRRAVPLLAALWMLSSAACDRRVAPYVDREGEPPAPAHPVQIPGLERPLPGRGSAAPGPMDLLRPSAKSRAAAPQPEAIRGVVRVPAGVRPNGATLFAIARSPGGGPPLAVRRWSPSAFPAEFELGPGDVMLPGRRFEGPLFLSLRLDADGDASTRSAADLSATVAHPVQPGERDIELTLVEEGATAQAAPPRPAARESIPQTPAAAGAETSASIEGTLRASGDVAIPAAAVVFLIARSTAGGPPLAVRKLPAGPFPMSFRIGPEHTMIEGRPFHGPMQLSARLDEDGDALSRGKRDASGEAAAPVEPGATGVEIVLRAASPR